MTIQLRSLIIFGLFAAGGILGDVIGVVVAEDVYEFLADVGSTPPSVVVTDNHPPASSARERDTEADVYWLLSQAEPGAKTTASQPRGLAGCVTKTSSRSTTTPETSPAKVVLVEEPSQNSQKAVAVASVAIATAGSLSSNDVFDLLTKQPKPRHATDPALATSRPAAAIKSARAPGRSVAGGSACCGVQCG